MTMTVTEHSVTTKRKKHPNDGRYPCRASQEVLNAGMKLIGILSAKERILFKENELVLDEEESAELYDNLKVGDVIGLGLLRKPGYYLGAGFSAHQFEIKAIIKGEDYLLCINRRSKEEEEISFQDVSIGLALGFAEILYREEKPYGVSEDEVWNFTIKHEETEESKKTDEDAASSRSTESIPKGPPALTTEDSIEETISKIEIAE